MKRYFKFVLLLGICLIFLTGCIVDLVIPENDSSSPTQEDGVVTGKGIIKIYLTDAPGDYKEVNINIFRIEGHIAGDGEEGEDKGSWKVLKEWDEEDLLVNLIELENVSMLLGSKELAANKYTQLRIFLKEEATLVLEGEGGPDEPTVEKPLEIPSSANTGIKLNHPFEIVAGIITKLTIDFDAEKSVIETGNGKYKMKPVISVSSETYSEEDIDTGTVSGIVLENSETEPPIIGASVSVSLSGGVYIFSNSAVTDVNGEFVFEQLPVGSYDLTVSAEGYVEYNDVTPGGIVVTAGGILDVGIIELELLPPPLP